MDTVCIIPLDGLKAGKSAFKWHLDRKFFEMFENSEIFSANLKVDCTVDKSGNYFGVDCAIKGSVTVECDRCLGDLELPVDTSAYLSVKFADVAEPVSEETEGERELYFVPKDVAELDMSQVVYDYICTSLPLQRVHEEGKCDKEVEKYLSSETECEESEPQMENPFAALKNLL